MPSAAPTSKPSEGPSSTSSAIPSAAPSSAPTPEPITPAPTTPAPTSEPTSVRLDASDAEPKDFFGYSVAIVENRVVIGSYGDDENGEDSGSAYLCARNGEFLTKIIPSDGAANDNFGRRVAMSSEYIVIGSYSSDNGDESGSVYLYSTDGTLIDKILPFDGAANDLFGSSVAISVDRIVVGAYGADDEKGSAYIYTIDGDLVEKITAPDGEADDRYGFSISVSGDTIVVRTVDDEDAGTSSGSAHVFRTNGDYVTKLTAFDATQADKFGQSVAVSGDTIAVGSYWDDDNGEKSGSVYLYDTDGNYVTKLRAPDGKAGDRFGFSVGISGDRIVIGSIFNDEKALDGGAVYIFDIDGTFIDKVMAPDGEDDDFFGWSVSLSGDNMVVGASYKDANGISNSGSTYICIEFDCEYDL